MLATDVEYISPGSKGMCYPYLKMILRSIRYKIKSFSSNEEV